MDIDVDTRILVMTVVVLRRMLVMLLVIPVFYTTGGEQAGHEKEQERSGNVLYFIFHNNNFVLRSNGKTLPVLKTAEIAGLSRFREGTVEYFPLHPRFCPKGQ
jgi:hypothetical protein